MTDFESLTTDERRVIARAALKRAETLLFQAQLDAAMHAGRTPEACAAAENEVVLLRSGLANLRATVAPLLADVPTPADAE